MTLECLTLLIRTCSRNAPVHRGRKETPPAEGLAHSSMPEAWRDLQQRLSAAEALLERGELEECLEPVSRGAVSRVL